MSIIPCSNRIIVKEIKTEENETAFLVPEEYSSRDENFKLYKFVQAGSLCKNDYVEGDKLLVESHLVEEAKILGEKIFLVGEPGVVCIVRDD